MSGRPHDFEYLAYKLIETASQVWDNKFYLVYDFTEYYYYIETVTIEYANLIANSGTKLLFSNCQRVYYFNIPRIENPGIMEGVKLVRSKGEKYGTKVYIYRLQTLTVSLKIYVLIWRHWQLIVKIRSPSKTFYYMTQQLKIHACTIQNRKKICYIMFH